MAQLPPKIPFINQPWPSFPSFPMAQIPSTTTSAAAASQNNSWVDEFLDFSATRRSSHRPSASDPTTFLESPFGEECRNSSGSFMPCSNNNGSSGGGGGSGFERLDDDQLRSMFSDNLTTGAPSSTTRSTSNPSSTNPSTPSDQNSENDMKTTPSKDQQQQPKNETGEVDSSCQPQTHIQSAKLPENVSGDVIVDPKRVKRILANRQSAQRSRVRKLQYISELERSVTTLQTEVSALSPRVAFLDHQRLILNVDNSALKQRIAALAQDKIFKDAHQEALKKEIERLRKIYHEQNLKKMGSNSNGGGAAPSPRTAPPPSYNNMACKDEL